MQAVEETKSHVEKKQALTYEEMEAEREEVVFCHHLCSILGDVWLLFDWMLISFANFFSMRPWNGQSLSESGLIIIDLHQFLWKWLWKFLDIFDSGSAVYVTRCLFLQ